MASYNLDFEIGIKVEVVIKEVYKNKPPVFVSIIEKIVQFFLNLFNSHKDDDNFDVPIDEEINQELCEEEANQLFFSKVIDILENDIVILYPPMAKMMTLALWEGDIVGLHYVLYQKGRYISSARVIRVGEDEIAVKLTGESSRIQERENYRVNVLEIVSAKILQIKDTEVHIYDISYTGAKIKIKDEDILHVGDILLMQIPSDNHRYVSTEVVREAGVQTYGIRFLDLTQEEQTKLENFIMQQHRKTSVRFKRFK